VVVLSILGKHPRFFWQMDNFGAFCTYIYI
jgi:hypothetical protein